MYVREEDHREVGAMQERRLKDTTEERRDEKTVAREVDNFPHTALRSRAANEMYRGAEGSQPVHYSRLIAGSPQMDQLESLSFGLKDSPLAMLGIYDLQGHWGILQSAVITLVLHRRRNTRMLQLSTVKYHNSAH